MLKCLFNKCVIVSLALIASFNVSRAGVTDTVAEGGNAVSSMYNGLGLNIGVMAFYPAEVNEMIIDIYDELKSGYAIIGEMGAPSMFMGYPLKLKGVFYLNSHMALEPYGQFLWAGKYLFISGAGDESAWVHLFFFSGGVNLWFRFNPEKRVSFKTGLGGFGGYSLLKVTGDVGDVGLKGPGYGGNLLAGLDLTFGKVAVNIDFVVPAGMVEYTGRTGGLDIEQTGDYTFQQTTYDHYPRKILLLGFEFRPGITFRF